MIKRQFFRDALVLNKTIQAAEVNPRQRRGKARHKHRAGIMLCGSICGVIVCHGESNSPTSRVLPSQPWNKGLFSPAVVLRPQACDTQSPGCCLSRGRTTLQVGTKEWLIPSTWYRVLNIPQKLWVSSFTYLELFLTIRGMWLFQLFYHGVCSVCSRCYSRSSRTQSKII